MRRKPKQLVIIPRGKHHQWKLRRGEVSRKAQIKPCFGTAPLFTSHWFLLSCCQRPQCSVGEFTHWGFVGWWQSINAPSRIELPRQRAKTCPKLHICDYDDIYILLHDSNGHKEMAASRLENVTQTIARILEGYDIRLRPNFGGNQLEWSNFFCIMLCWALELKNLKGLRFLLSVVCSFNSPTLLQFYFESILLNRSLWWVSKTCRCI